VDETLKVLFEAAMQFARSLRASKANLSKEELDNLLSTAYDAVELEESMKAKVETKKY
jgi:hypothetical protein